MDSVQSVIWRDAVKTLIDLAVGTLLALGAVTSAAAAGTNLAGRAQAFPAGIEVIVVTAKRPTAEPGQAAQPIEEIIVTAKRVAQPAEPVRPVMAIDLPKVEFAVSEPLLIRL
jgi:hypothetical protein